MRLVLVGSGQFGLLTFQRLHQMHEVAGVISQPDRPSGRRRRPAPTPIADWAQTVGLRVLKAEDVNTAAFVEHVRGLEAAAAVIIAFGQKLGEPMVRALGTLTFNLHASLLPKYRGAAPINWAIMDGQDETGLSAIAISPRMDAGEIYGQVSTRIDREETAGELHDRLAALGPALAQRVLERFEAGSLKGRPQDDAQATRAPKLRKSDGPMSFDLAAERFCNRVRGLTPWPGATVIWRHQPAGVEQPLILCRVQPQAGVSHEHRLGTITDRQYRVAVRGGLVRLVQVQIPGGKPMSIEQFVHGHPLRPADVLL